MPTPDTNGLPPFADFEMMKAKINELVAKYNNLLVNLDSLNVVSLTADHIDAGTIDANLVTIRSDLSAGAYVQINGNGMVINNGSFNTFTADINGNVTMTRALIQSSPSSYPRVVVDPTNELFGAYATANRYARIESNPNLLGAPMANFGFDGAETWLAQVANTFFIYSPSGAVNIGPTRTVLNGSVRLGGTQDLRFSSVPGASDPDEAVTSINVLLAYLSAMGILP